MLLRLGAALQPVAQRDGEDGATYEVEVRKPNGSVVDVRLDASYGVVVIEGDQESNDGPDAGNDG